MIRLTLKKQFWRRLVNQSQNPRSIRRFTIGIASSAVIISILIYTALAGSFPFAISLKFVPLLAYLNLALLVILVMMLLIRIGRFWLERRQLGARLHRKMMIVFGCLTLLPTFIITISSTLFFDLGLNAWFSERVRTSLSESLKVSEAYLSEHARTIRIDAFKLARTIDARQGYIQGNPARLQNILRREAGIYGLSEAVIVDANHNVIARAGLTILLESEPVSSESINAARTGEIVAFTERQDDRVRALTRLESIPGTFLYVGRLVDASVIAYYLKARSAVSDFTTLEDRQSEFRTSFALIFVLLSLLLVTISLWTGFALATRFTQPIGDLLVATNNMREGDFSTRVATDAHDDEFKELALAFNRMAQQISDQHEKLFQAYQDIDERHQFNENVLKGVSAGVVGLDQKKCLKIFNPSAEALLKRPLKPHFGQPITDIIPEMKEVMAQMGTKKTVDTQMPLSLHGGKRRFLIRVLGGKAGEGYVITFDDITELMTAQRKAAWSDVARRIAHEIKNPLTPIQLAAERLKRKFVSKIQKSEDGRLLAELADTIIRQVDVLERMVDSFSRFAQMPKAVMAENNIRAMCHEAMILQSSAHPTISFKEQYKEAVPWLRCDRQLIMQALTNLLKNAVDSIVEAGKPGGTVRVATGFEEGYFYIDVIDDGKGLGSQIDQAHIGEPYYTTRPNGTGLGTAIVIRIMEEHKGRFSIINRPGRAKGACARLSFPNTLLVKPKIVKKGTLEQLEETV